MEKEEKSSRNYDKKISREMEKIYDKIYSYCGYETRRVYDKTRQVMGVDVIIDGHMVDEKCAHTKWDTDLQTFVIELEQSTGDESRVTGWFNKPESMTEFYNFGFVRATSEENLSKGIVTRFETVLVSKDKIKTFIEERTGKTIKELVDAFKNEKKLSASEKEQLVGGKKKNIKYQSMYDNGLKLFVSSHKEGALNIIVPKYVLCNMAVHHTVLTYSNGKENFKKIK